MKLIKICLYLFFFFLLFASFQEVYAKTIAVIANVRYPKESVSIRDIKDIYTGDKLIDAGLKIKPVDQIDDTEIKKLFLKSVLHISISDYNSFWIQRLFQRGGIPPKIKEDSEDVIRFVSANDTGIGYVWLEEVEGKDKIKILLKIDVK
ncbi:MAG: hypothetical protein ACE5EA_00365 [Nitrospirota bacterium]